MTPLSTAPPVSVERRPVAFTYQGQNKICAGPSSLQEAINTASSTAFFNLDPATVELQFEHFGIWYVRSRSGRLGDLSSELERPDDSQGRRQGLRGCVRVARAYRRVAESLGRDPYPRSHIAVEDH